MMDLTILANLAGQFGAPLVKSILDRTIGGDNAALADAVVRTIAGHAGVAPSKLPEIATAAPDDVRSAVLATEAIAPELVAIYARGLDGQFALLQAETAEGPLQSGWRWGWMYLLAFFWIWRLVILPIVNASLGAAIEAPDPAIMMTLTSWFIALYMGGHTVKDLGTKAIEAVREWRGTR